MVRRFPFLVGRSAEAGLALDDPGVWDRHATLEFRPGEGFFVRAHEHALVSVNQEPVSEARLRNGDLLQCGSARIRFWLAALPQRSLRLRETLTWVAWAALFAAQLGLVYFLAA